METSNTSNELNDIKIQEQKIVASLSEFIRDLSLKHLIGYSKIDDFEIDQSPLDDGNILAHWVSMILASGSALRVTFKVHFMSRQMRKIASKSLDTEPKSIPYLDYTDFAKEFCNLLVGQLKNIMHKNKITIGISLPLITRGFDEIFIRNDRMSQQFKDLWRLKTGNCFVDCTSIIEIFDYSKLQNLVLKEESKNDDDEEIVFL